MNIQRFTRESSAGTVRFVRRASLKNIILPCTILSIIHDTEMKVRHPSLIIMLFLLQRMNMKNFDMATYLVEELIKQLPELFHNNQSHGLLHKAVDVLNELLIFCKIEICDKGHLPADVDMKKEPPEEEEESMVTFQSDVPEYNYRPPSPVNPVIIRVMKQTAPESEEPKPVFEHSVTFLSKHVKILSFFIMLESLFL